MYTEFNDRAWLSWLAKVRIIIITFIFGIELAISRLTTTNVPLVGFLSLILLWYTISVFEILLVALWRETLVQWRLQILTDIAFCSAILYVTGGIDTFFNFLYPLIILVAGIRLSRAWAYLAAGLCSVLFGGILELTQLGILHSYATSPRPDDRALQFVIGVNLCAYFAVAYLASNLSAKLRQVDVEALENLQALHENIINSMNGGLITTDLEGRITLLNPAGERLLERRMQYIVGHPAQELFLDRLPDVETSVLKGELRSVTPAGREKILGVKTTLLRVAERGDLGYLYSFADLTEIRRLEREVRMHDRLSAVGRLAAGIAHEIRNPLSSIAGSVNVLSKIAALTDEQHTLVKIVTRESERLNHIISDFLIYSREKTFKFTPENLVPLLEDTLTLLENHPLIAGRGDGMNSRRPPIKIIRDFGTRQARAMVDGDRMKQVFWNLCDNAARAMKEGGTLTVGLRNEGDSWVIRVADSGPGISRAQLEKIFEPFQSQFEGGTGLGLAIVYQIVQAHQGHITVRSTPGEGAEFCLTLPQTQAAEMADYGVEGVASRSGQARAKVAHG